MSVNPQHTVPEDDLFVSYSPADRDWMEGYLLDALNAVKLRVLSDLNFIPGRVAQQRVRPGYAQFSMLRLANVADW